MAKTIEEVHVEIMKILEENEMILVPNVQLRGLTPEEKEFKAKFEQAKQEALAQMPPQ